MACDITGDVVAERLHQAANLAGQATNGIPTVRPS